VWRRMVPQLWNIEMDNMKKTVRPSTEGAVTDFIEPCNKASGSIKCGTFFLFFATLTTRKILRAMFTLILYSRNTYSINLRVAPRREHFSHLL